MHLYDVAIRQTFPAARSANATDDPRRRLDGLVPSTIGVRFYVGVPLVSSDGYNVGTLCVFDRTAQSNPKLVEMLTALSKIVSDELDLRLPLHAWRFKRRYANGQKRKAAMAMQIALDESSLRENAQTRALTATQAASDETSLRENADLEMRGLSGRYEHQLREYTRAAPHVPTRLDLPQGVREKAGSSSAEPPPGVYGCRLRDKWTDHTTPNTSRNLALGISTDTLTFFPAISSPRQTTVQLRATFIKVMCVSFEHLFLLTTFDLQRG